MTPSHAVKNGVRYRYYISSVLIQGQPDKAATLNRVPAAEIETLIVSALRKHLAEQSNDKGEAEDSQLLNDKDLISAHIARVDIKPDHLAVQLSFKPGQRSGEQSHAGDRRHGFVRCSDHWLRSGLCLHTHSTRPQRPCLDQRHNKSDSRMDCTPAHRGISLE